MDAEVDPFGDSSDTLHDVLGTPATQEAELDAERIAVLLRWVIPRLLPRERDLIMRHFFEDESLEEIAERRSLSRQRMQQIGAIAQQQGQKLDRMMRDAQEQQAQPQDGTAGGGLTPEQEQEIDDHEAIKIARAEMSCAIRAWMDCPAGQRPSARSLGERITQIASALEGPK